MDRQQYLIDRFKIDTTRRAPYFIACNRWKVLPYVFADMGLKIGVEVGTEQGRFADCLLRKIPNLTLSVVDCWEAYPEYREKMQPKIDDYYQRCIERIGDKATIYKMYSMDAVKQFADESLDFVYIDGNHNFQSTTNDIAEWSKKVKKGGVIAGHDYVHNNVGYERTDVKEVVDAWTLAHDINVWFVTDEPGRCPTWLWIKQ